jgi:hypothetical protein
MPRTTVLFFALALPLLPARAQEAAEAKPCSRPELQQIAFWAGDWTAEWTAQDGARKTGSNRVEWILDGCVLQENFTDPEGLVGKSWSVFEPASGRWRQTWVDNQGGYLDFVGEFKDDKMSFEREALIQGETRRQRMSFYNIGADRFDWDWEISRDGGKTWNLAWRIHYTRKK